MKLMNQAVSITVDMMTKFTRVNMHTLDSLYGNKVTALCIFSLTAVCCFLPADPNRTCYVFLMCRDIYRAEWSFLILFAPERINGMITSMLQTYKEGGRLPIWQNIVETNTMVGTHSSSLIAEALGILHMYIMLNSFFCVNVPSM